jgi:hypothetical protein
MLGFVRRMPFFKLLAVAQTMLLARRHLGQLDAHDRRRLAALVRRGRGMTRAERDELRRLLSKMEPGSFAAAAADRFSPVPLKWLSRRGARA